MWLTASAVMAASAVPAAGEVYLNEAQALAIILGDKAVIRKEQKTLDEALRRTLENSSNLHFPELSYTFFIASQAGQAAKFAIQMNEIGKTEPITFMVGISPEGKVTEAVIMVFRENRGWEVKEKRFLNQFRGKTIRSAIRVNEDIINYTGATLSSKAVARGVKRALLLLDAFYPGASRTKVAPTSQFVRPLPLSPVLTATNSRGRLSLYRQSRYAMGSICEIRLWCRSPEEALNAFASGFAEIEREEQVFSAYRDNSELALVNREAGYGAVSVTEEFHNLTKYAVQSWRNSRGAVDVTVGPLMKAWGLWQGNPHVPARTDFLEARNLVGCDKIRLDERRRTVQFQRQGMELDFGGLAKGHAAKRASRVLEKQGVVAALVNLGGSSLCASEVAPSPVAHQSNCETELAIGEWPVGILHPADATQCATYLLLKPGWTLSTSGTYERQFEAGGKKLSHILDPRTGWPLEGRRSVTAIARSGRRCEALAKQLLLLSHEESSATSQRFEHLDWALFEASETGALESHIHFARLAAGIS
jgi:thiamine biosynthesis lipoprotein ApbE/Na+-translocating ferredoxin:NAD+ oxidoreductase RnfG subunit